MQTNINLTYSELPVSGKVDHRRDTKHTAMKLLRTISRAISINEDDDIFKAEDWPYAWSRKKK